MSSPVASAGSDAAAASAAAPHKRVPHSSPFAYLNEHRTTTHLLQAQYADATIEEPEYTQEEKTLMEELRKNVAALILDPEKMKCTADDYPGGMHKHWTTYWPQGKDHPMFIDTYSQADTIPENWPEHELIRFLRARDMNLKKATKMYFNYRRWRIVYGASHIAAFTTMPYEPLIQSILSHSYHKIDKHGRPLYVQRSGLIDPHRFSSEVSLEQIGIGHTWFCEEMARRAVIGSKITGKRQNKIVSIIDIAGVSLAGRKMLKIFSTTSFIDQNFYPETLGQLNLINAPSFFPVLYSICKTFLSANTQKKVKIIGSNYKPILLEDLGPECLPVEYGGTCVCEGGCCPVATGPGYVRPGEEDAEEETITIKAGHAITHELPYMHSITYSAEEGGEEAQECWWSVDVTAKDCDYSVTFVPSAASADAAAPEPIELAKVERVAHGVPATGVYAGPTSGIVKITLSNEYSRWSSKTIKLRTGTRPKQQSTH